jgi:formamidopyrimidine-DNA glycosylase
MPELPEVETVVRTLAPHVVGRTILDARFLSPHAAAHRPEELAARLQGRRILAVRRVGKFIVADLDHGILSIHLRMTGKLLLNAAPGPFTRAILELDCGSVLFDDVRQFGRMEWCERISANIARLGPDALALTPDEFAARFRARRGAIKPLLLNQAVLAGLGNIYVDEALFRAGVHPLAPADRLSRPRLQRLRAAIVEVLSEAIAAGGSSISDYADAQGQQGAFQRFHRVYGRQDEPCPECGTAVRRIVVGQRGTHFCPRCQSR